MKGEATTKKAFMRCVLQSTNPMNSPSERIRWGLPWQSMVDPVFHNRGEGFDPLLGNKDPTWLAMQPDKKKKRKIYKCKRFPGQQTSRNVE